MARLSVPEADLRADRVTRRFPTGVNLVYAAPTVARAREVWEKYVRQSMPPDDQRQV